MSRSVTRFEIHPGIYKDSLVLMRMQSRLLDEQGVLGAAATMAGVANLELLAEGGLLPEGLPDLEAQDLLVVVRADDDQAAEAALARVAELLVPRGSSASQTFRPHGLDGALSHLPEARWALVSVPGLHAARVSEDALERGLNVFLFSDNVALADEARLKEMAAARSLLLLGPDCGTAILAGTGLGFANRLRRGPIGLVGGSGTGLQAVSVALHGLGAGVSQVIGTGGRDLSARVGGVATRQGLQILADDPDTDVIALVSKSPDPPVAARALQHAAGGGKPIVAYTQGQRLEGLDGVRPVDTLAEVAPAALRLAGISGQGPGADSVEPPLPPAPQSPGHLRGLFAGGTLAAEVLLGLEGRVAPLHSNLSGAWHRLSDPHVSRGHSVIDLGADELTRGRLHPMIDLRPRIERLRREAADEEVGVVLMDVILGDGAHADPASELADAIERALEVGAGRRPFEIVVLLLGTDEDPQDLDSQRQRLAAAGAIVLTGIDEAIEHVARRVASGPEPRRAAPSGPLEVRPVPTADDESPLPAVPPAAVASPLAAINVGLECFHTCLLDQGASSIDLDWRPPAGGDERLTAILDRIAHRGGPSTERRR